MEINEIEYPLEKITSERSKNLNVWQLMLIGITVIFMSYAIYLAREMLK